MRACYGLLYPVKYFAARDCAPALNTAIPDRDLFYVADPIRSIEIHSLPTLTHCYPRNFIFYVAHPIRSIRRRNTCHNSRQACRGQRHTAITIAHAS